MWNLIDRGFRAVQHFGPQEWLLTLFAVLLLGFVLLRGFGSRTNY